MTTKLKVAITLLSGTAAIAVAALFTGTLDPVLRNLGVEFAGRPAAELGGSTEVPGTAAPVTAPSGLDAVGARERVVPIFDLVRVEPTGDAVIAGQGVPDSAVEILSGETVIASGRANATGEWAIVLTEPLRAGAHDLTVRAIQADGGAIVSEQSVAVSVPEGGRGEVLVVLNQPGEAATVLQLPGLEAEIADAPPAPPAVDPTPAIVVAEAPAAVPDAPNPVPAPTVSTEASVAPTAPVEPTEPATIVAQAEIPGSNASPTEAPAVTNTPAPVTGTTAEPMEKPDSASAEATVAPTPSLDSAIATGPAAAPAAPATETTVAAGRPVSAGDAADPNVPAPAGVDAALGNPFAAVAPDPVAADAPIPPAGGADSAGTEPVATPSITPAPAAVEPTVSVAGEAPPIEAPAVEAPAPEPVEPIPVTVEAVELENGERFFAAGAAAPGAAIRLYVNEDPVADSKAMPTGRWLVERTLPLDPGAHTVRVDQVASDGSVVARAEVPFTIAELASPPTAVAGTGDAAAGSGLAGEARVAGAETLIIRQGDNLWQIARRLYGRGVRYSTIYEANTDQIRNPNLIYPGQVFVIPKGDTEWGETGAN